MSSEFTRGRRFLVLGVRCCSRVSALLYKVTCSMVIVEGEKLWIPAGETAENEEQIFYDIKDSHHRQTGSCSGACQESALQSPEPSQCQHGHITCLSGNGHACGHGAAECSGASGGLFRALVFPTGSWEISSTRFLTQISLLHLPAYPPRFLFGKPFDGGKRMETGGQHPGLQRLQEVQREVQGLGKQVGSFSGLQSDREYRRLERELTRQLLEVDAVDTEGKAEVQQARKRAAQEVEGLLRLLEENSAHPSRLAIEGLSQEAQRLVEAGVLEPQRAGAGEISDELVESLQDLVLRLTQVKTGGRVPLRKARYRALTRVCAVQDVIEGRTRRQTLPLPLSEDTHAAVQRINMVMARVSQARSELIALLMGLGDGDSCAHLARVLTELLVELDALDVSGNAAVRNYRKQVVEEIHGLLKHLDLEGEGDDTCRYDLAQNDSIQQIEVLRGRVAQLRRQLISQDSPGELGFKPKAELQGFLTQLDEVSTARNPCIREARRRAVLEVQAVITYIDLREALVRRLPTAEEHPSQRAVWQVLASLSELQGQVLSFDGKRADKSYMVLEEMLTKQLLALDAVDPQGDEMSKVARKQAVKFAQNILGYLDMKTDEWEY
ncbi:BAG family molecular chaperone regulator 5 isoform X3 [Lepisosteus oculatus]|uniref:BAG family molecular chaperone regulator 5 isoform X3 n=1 Tax=Lepisosteus oculatus TaxID=7918 RepID=UPI0037196837